MMRFNETLESHKEVIFFWMVTFRILIWSPLSRMSVEQFHFGQLIPKAKTYKYKIFIAWISIESWSKKSNFSIFLEVRSHSPKSITPMQFFKSKIIWLFRIWIFQLIDFHFNSQCVTFNSIKSIHRSLPSFLHPSPLDYSKHQPDNEFENGIILVDLEKSWTKLFRILRSLIYFPTHDEQSNQYPCNTKMLQKHFKLENIVKSWFPNSKAMQVI